MSVKPKPVKASKKLASARKLEKKEALGTVNMLCRFYK
jgi:hypothetical protein